MENHETDGPGYYHRIRVRWKLRLRKTI
jgi:hypothetical protein